MGHSNVLKTLILIFLSSLSQEESNPPEEKEEPNLAPVVEEIKKLTEDFEERRVLAIATKAQEIEKVTVLVFTDSESKKKKLH